MEDFWSLALQVAIGEPELEGLRSAAGTWSGQLPCAYSKELELLRYVPGAHEQVKCSNREVATCGAWRRAPSKVCFA